MKRGIAGYYETDSSTGETVKAFIPNVLPPSPSLQISLKLREKMNSALLALGRLDSVTRLLPDTALFLYMYIRKEAVLSSQIEGTQSSLSDLLLFEADGMPGVPINDVREVSSYVSAMNYGLQRLRGDFPLSLRLIKEIHAELLSSGRGSSKSPGEFRTSQNWIGGTRPGNAVYVPPPPHKLMDCLGAWEKFLHDQPDKTEVLIKAALAHAQFETIHPFLDGNGRLGRLLITFIFCHENILREPMLYLSLYFKTYRQQYYDLLQRTRTEGDWESWIEFFVNAVEFSATKAVETSDRLVSLAETDRKRIQSLGKIAGSAIRIHHVFMQKPIQSSDAIGKAVTIVPNTVNKVLSVLMKEGMVTEITGKKRNRLYAYTKYLDILSDGTQTGV